MGMNRILRMIAGFMIMLTVVLSELHHHSWIWLSLFIGANLFQSSFTNWCPMTSVLESFGFKKD